MRAAVYRQFDGPILIEDVPEPEPSPDGVVIEVRASGLCRSDLHGWHGLDPDVELPMVPGHELAGVIDAVGSGVQRWTVGDRVTIPFCCGCGVCGQCRAGNTQICDDYFQPGFTAWGSFAQLVAVSAADVNLVALPEDLDYPEAAILGCRFITAYRAVVERGRLDEGEWLAVHGCGGLGLSAVMIAAARGARVVAIDIDDTTLDLARSLGAEATVNATAEGVPDAVVAITAGGAHVSIDALGSPRVAADALLGLRKLGRHVQVGLLNEGPAPLPMDAVVARELEILGSHGMAVGHYGEVLDLIADLDLSTLITRRLSLDELPEALESMRGFSGAGISVVTSFD
ncbi:MAG: zinc-dependent alcohol dehydrogenase family protein [Acidimicrobiia bacterium]|nr:MAG: zinc-dependent alcohol dehydrogenase family protein [Acidimicrobiia bacterium]